MTADLDAVLFGAITNGQAPPKQPWPGTGRMSPECASTLTPPVLDHRYKATPAGPQADEFLLWLEIKGKAPRTLDQYQRDLAVGCLLIRKPITEWTDADMLRVAQAFKPASRDTRLAPYRGMFRRAIKKRQIAVNPCDDLEDIGRPGQRVHDNFTAAERAMLVGGPIEDRLLMALMLDAGPRQCDCVALQWKNLRLEPTSDMPYGGVAFLKSKRDKDRIVPCTERTWLWAQELQVMRGPELDDYVWYTRPQGRALSRKRQVGHGSFCRWYERILRSAGVRYRKPHTTRHTFATCYLRGELPGQLRPGRIETLQVVLGHKSIQTTADLYGHLDMRDVSVDMGLTESVWG